MTLLWKQNFQTLMQECRKKYLRPYCIKLLVHVFCTYDLFTLSFSKMVQNVRVNPYFDISSKSQICQKCHLRPYCIQPSKYHCDYLPHTTFRFYLIYFQLNADFPSQLILRFYPKIALLKDRFPKKMLKKSKNPSPLRKTIGSSISFTLAETISGF